MDTKNMDSHWNFTCFTEGDTGETITAIHICAYGDLVDGRPTRHATRSSSSNGENNASSSQDVYGGDDDTQMTDVDRSSSDACPANHWCLFLELADGRGVKLDMSPGYQPGRPYREGTILVSSRTTQSWLLQGLQQQQQRREGEDDDNLVKSLRFSVLIDGTTVAQVLENINFNSRHRYLFSEQTGEGSRFWVYTVVMDLEAVQLLGQGDAKRAEDVMSLVWGADGAGGTERRLVRRGMFTDWMEKQESKKIGGYIFSR